MNGSINIKILGQEDSQNEDESFLVSFDNGVKILVDSGDSAGNLDSLIDTKNLQEVEIFIITHIDQDHIKGFENLLKNEKFLNNNNLKFIIFNYINNPCEISYKQAISLKMTIDKYYKNKVNLIQSNFENYDSLNEKLDNIAFMSLEKRDLLPISLYPEKIFITFITPTDTQFYNLQEDWYEFYKKNKDGKKHKGNAKVINESSLCVLIEYKNSKILLTGDQFFENISQIFNSKRHNKLEKEKNSNRWNIEKIDLIKIPHHGSLHSCSTLVEFSSEISCTKFLIFRSNKVREDQKVIEEIFKNIGDSAQIYTGKNIKLDDAGNSTNFELIEI